MPDYYPNAKKPRKPTKEEVAHKAERMSNYLAQQGRDYEAKYGKLPGAKTFGQRHPSIGQFIPESVDALIDPGLNYLRDAFGGGGTPVEFGLDAQGRPLSTQQFGAGPNETVVPKTSQPEPAESQPLNHGQSARDALRGALGPAIKSIHDKYGVDEAEADTILHGFMDSSEGRALGDQLLGGSKKDLLDSGRKKYDSFVKSWTGKGNQRSVELPDPVVVDLATATPQEIAAALKGDKPVLGKNAEAAGFLAEKVLVYGKGRTKSDPNKLLDSTKTPAMTRDDFLETIKAGMGGIR